MKGTAMTIRNLFKLKAAVVLGGVLATLAMTSPTAFAASAPPGGAGPAVMAKAGIPAAGIKVVRINPNDQTVACGMQALPVECQIIEPTVTQQSTVYPGVVFSPGEHVSVLAGGCVQTGGHGLTWKRYVNPTPDVGLYHGTIFIPGATSGLIPVQNAIGAQYTVGINGGTLQLGYVDDGYSDNGYYAHDNGTSDQCKNVENAWVDIFIS
jgi:hypothetical protein